MNLSLTADHYTEWCQCFNRYIVGKNTKVSEEKYEAFWEQLKDVPFQAVVQACEELKGTPGPFIADPGTWKTMAVAIAAEMRAEYAAIEARRLTAPASVAREEETAFLKARAHAVEQVEEHLGRSLKPNHPWVSRRGHVPTYCCRVCMDTGFRKLPPTQAEVEAYGKDGGWGTVEHCLCWNTNPVLVRNRANNEARRAERKRSAIK
jgi:hypothetical protein